MIIEWNAHIFSPDTQRYPLHPKATYRPDVSVHPPDPLAAYLQRLDDEGSTGPSSSIPSRMGTTTG